MNDNITVSKKKFPLPLKVLIIGVIIGLAFCGFGLFKQFEADRINNERKEEALKQSETAINNANARLKEIGDEYYPLKEELEKKKQECDAIETGSDGWFEAKNKCNREAQEMQSKLWNLEAEDKTIKSKDYTGYYDLVDPMSYIVFYIIGGVIAGLAALGAFIIYLVKGNKSY